MISVKQQSMWTHLNNKQKVLFAKIEKEKERKERIGGRHSNEGWVKTNQIKF